MAEALAVIKTTANAILAIADALEVNSENKKEISKLISDVQTDMKDLTQLQKGYTGDRGELDNPFLDLIAKLKEIRNECKGLTSKPSGSGIKRIYTHGNNIYNAKTTEKKITKLRDSLRDAKLSFLVSRGFQNIGQNNVVTIQQVTITNVSQLQEDSTAKVMSAPNDPYEAGKTSVIKQKTMKQVRAELRKTPFEEKDTGTLSSVDSSAHEKRTEDMNSQRRDDTSDDGTLTEDMHWTVRGDTSDDERRTEDMRCPARDDASLDVKVTTKDHRQSNRHRNKRRNKCDTHRTSAEGSHTPNPFKLFNTGIDANFDALKEALVSEVPSLKHRITAKGKQKHKPITDNSYGDAHDNSDGSSRRRNILVEIVAVLDELQSTVYQSSSLALEKFTRIDALACSLRSLGLRKSALQFCIKAHEIIRELWDNDRDYCRYLAESLMNLAACRGDAGDLDGALASSKEAVSIYSPSPVISREDALAESQEVIDVISGLAKVEPEVYNPKLASVLTHHSIRLSDAGKEVEALAAIEEAVYIRRALAEGNVDAFGLDLAQSLRYLSLRFSGVGKRDKALATIQEAEGLYKQHSEYFPDAFHGILADIHEILHDCLRAVGNTEEPEDMDEEEGRPRNGNARPNRRSRRRERS